MSAGTPDLDLRGFEDFARFEDIRNRLAVTDGNELVRIVDWQDTHYDGERVLVVTDADPESPCYRQLSWRIKETRLTPVFPVTFCDHLAKSVAKERALAQAERWRAARQEKQMETDTAQAQYAVRPARL